MSCVLYYSNYCNNSKNLLQVMSKSKIKEQIHFCSIDNRIKKSDGNIYIVLQNKQEIILPPTITKVPSLLLLNKGNQVLTGNDTILNFLKPQEEVITQKSTNFNGEPLSFSFGGGGGCGGGGYLGVVSDNYSFLDQNADELSSKGNGGLRQLYHYTTLDHVDSIETPPDTYVPDKIKGTSSVDKLRQDRNNN